MTRKICIVTGSRAEYGMLYRVMKGIQDDSDLELKVIVTGMHLSPEFGLTWRVIEEDGFRIDANVEMLLSSDSAVGVTKSIGLGVIGFADALDRLRPDLLMVLGDRFEILAAVQAALVARIPVAHIAGGDTTEGAFDEAIRHSITKMSHLHFVTNHVAARRVRQLGEDPRTIHLVGSPGLDQIKLLSLLDRDQLTSELDFRFCKRNLLVTFHPATLDADSSDTQFRALLDALDALGPDVGIIFTKPNADTGGRIIIPMIDAFVARHPHARVYTSLGQLRYLSVLAQVDAVVGNSSSGLYEAPTLKKPAVNIGDRQGGRLQADSVLNCPASAKEIEQTIRLSFAHDCSMTVNPYGDGESAPRIISVLKEVETAGLLKKRFYDLGCEDA